jgi:hypothetical protein
MGKVTWNLQILESPHLDGTTFIYGDFQIDPLKKSGQHTYWETLLLYVSSAANLEVVLRHNTYKHQDSGIPNTHIR